MDGILNVDKPLRWTSHDVVGLVRRAIGRRQVGHAGTLDPLATGVLLVMVGAATRLSDYLMQSRKLYHARLRLGQRSSTDDAEGEIIMERPTDGVTVERVAAVLSSFLGTIEQIPPAYAAIKRDGVPAYKLARQGRAPEMAARKVRVDGLALLSLSDSTLDLLVWCSAGTYIRALARDIGESLGCGAYLAALRRLSSGSFGVDTALDVEEIRGLAAEGRLQTRLQPLDEAVSAWPAVVVDDDAAAAVLHGRAVPFSVDGRWSKVDRADAALHPSPFALRPMTEARLYASDGRFLALARYDERRGWQPRKVFTAAESAAGVEQER